MYIRISLSQVPLQMDFDQKVNPRILQRQARHKKIETTLRYDHTADEMVKELQPCAETSKYRRFRLQRKGENQDKLLAGEIDTKTFKNGIDILLPKGGGKDDDIAYL